MNASGFHGMRRIDISILWDLGAKLAMCQKAQRQHVMVLNAVLARQGKTSPPHVVTATP
jgi:hypothetical protein